MKLIFSTFWKGKSQGSYSNYNIRLTQGNPSTSTVTFFFFHKHFWSKKLNREREREREREDIIFDWGSIGVGEGGLRLESSETNPKIGREWFQCFRQSELPFRMVSMFRTKSSKWVQSLQTQLYQFIFLKKKKILIYDK